MISQNQYPCFSEEGKTVLPQKETIASYWKNGIEPIIFIDSCVCLHIVKIVDRGRDATNIDRQKIFALKEYLHANRNITINPFFALLELCTKEGRFDQQKFNDFKNRIEFFEKIHLKVLKSFKYDFERDFLEIRKSDQINYAGDLDNTLNKTYCALLKIRSLAMADPSKKSAEKNLIAFLDWMADDLDSVRGTEHKLAMYIFGGNTSFRKMIGLDSKPQEAKKKLLGTCWDIFHAKNASNSYRTFHMFKQAVHPYFITSDSNLFEIYRGLSLSLIQDRGQGASFVLVSDSSYPHFGEDFLQFLNSKMMSLYASRANRTANYDHSKVSRIIQELEEFNNF